MPTNFEGYAVFHQLKDQLLKTFLKLRCIVTMKVPYNYSQPGNSIDIVLDVSACSELTLKAICCYFLIR